MPDVFTILKQLELKSVGLDPKSNKMQEGYFVSFRNIGLPIHKDDFENPWSPLGVNLAKDIPALPPADPNTPKTASSTLSETSIFTANVARSQQAFLNTFLLTDDKLQMSGDYSVMPGSSKVSDSWYAIITGANGVPKDSDLTPEMQAAYDAARAKLMDADGNPTPHYQAYMDREDQYHDKVKALHKAYAAAFTDPLKLQAWPQDGVTYQDDVDEAWDRWVGFGFKNEIEAAVATLAAQGTDPAMALIARAKKRYMNCLAEFTGIGEIPYTSLLPASWYDPDDDDGWTEYSSADYHSESHYSASSTSFGGSAGISVGFFSIGGGFNHSDQRSSLDIQASDVDIRFKYMTADIKRMWCDTSLLNLGNWFLMGDYAKGCISTGAMAQEVPTEKGKEPTFLPSIVTSLILIKDLSISWSNWKSDWAAHAETNSASVSVGYGPFAVNGSYTHHDEQRDFSADATGERLEVPGIQLLGYVSTINPLAPGLDSAPYVKHEAA